MKHPQAISTALFFSLILALTLSVIFSPLFALAQIGQLPGQGGAFGGEGEIMTIKLFPAFPKANEPYIAELESFRVGFSNAPVVWMVNGEEVARGFNATKIQISAPSVGETQTIQVSTALQGSPYSVSRTVRPVALALRYEAQTYTPPFYTGIPLHTPGSRVTIQAFPVFPTQGGGQYNPKDLIYNWRSNGKRVSEVAGRGADALAINNSGVLRPMKISVDIFTQDGTLGAFGEIEIPVRQPMAVVYEHHPLMGVLYNRAVRNLELTETETSFVAEPFYFSLEKRTDPNLSFEWTIDGEKLNNSTDRLSLRQTPEASGQSRIGIQLKHNVYLLQRALARFGVEYTR